MYVTIPVMNKAELENKKAIAEQKFNELQKQERDIQDELLRLQGDYRAYNDLIAELETKPKKVSKDGSNSTK